MNKDQSVFGDIRKYLNAKGVDTSEMDLRDMIALVDQELCKEQLAQPLDLTRND